MHKSPTFILLGEEKVASTSQPTTRVCKVNQSIGDSSATQTQDSYIKSVVFYQLN